SFIAGKYETPIDRDSAFEVLTKRAETAAREAEEAERLEEEVEAAERELKQARRYDGKQVGRSSSRSSRRGASVGDKLTKMVVRELTGTTGKRIVRGILGSLFKGR
ncbi:MAG: helicase HerA-like domain-containing protein, partial [Pseudomonadota bacterium]